MGLSGEHQRAAADIRDAAGRSEAQAVQVANATTREDALSALLGVMTEASSVRDAAAGLYVALIEEGEE